MRGCVAMRNVALVNGRAAFPPHPGPLPLRGGEGESLGSAAGWFPTVSPKLHFGVRFPLPFGRGEGQGEGWRGDAERGVGQWPCGFSPCEHSVHVWSHCVHQTCSRWQFSLAWARDLRRVTRRVAPESLGRPAHQPGRGAAALLICRSKNSARWPTAAANSPRPRPTTGRGNDIVTYIVDRNVNYTNVCNVYCKFCAFYRTEKDDDAYVITLEEMDRKIEETVALGGTQILMQGGHHPKLTKQWYLDLLSHIKAQVPAGQHPRLQPERVHPFPRSVQRAAGENHRRFQGGRPGLDSRRRRGNSRGPRAPAHLAAQGDER